MSPPTYVTLPFGCRTSGLHVMSAITWIMSKHGHHVLVYVDNTRGVFNALLDICARLGVALAPDKYLPLAVAVIWLGLYLDSSR